MNSKLITLVNTLNDASSKGPLTITHLMEQIRQFQKENKDLLEKQEKERDQPQSYFSQNSKTLSCLKSKNSLNNPPSDQFDTIAPFEEHFDLFTPPRRQSYQQNQLNNHRLSQFTPSQESEKKQRNSAILKNLDHMYIYQFSIINKRQNQEEMVQSLKRNSLLIQSQITSPSTFTHYQKYNTIQENSDDSFEDYYSKQSTIRAFQDEENETQQCQLVKEKYLKIILLQKEDYIFKSDMADEKKEKKHNLDNNTRYLNLKNFENQIQNVLQNQEKVYKKYDLKKLKSRIFHVYHPDYDFDFSQNRLVKDAQKDDSNKYDSFKYLVLGSIKSNQLYSYFVKQNDFYRCCTIRNDFVYSHELKEDQKFEPQVQITFSNDKIQLKDLGCQNKVFIDLFQKNPLILEENQFFMIKNNFGFKIKSFENTKADHDFSEKDSKMFLQIIFVKKESRFLFEYQKLLLGCKGNLDYHFNFKQNHGILKRIHLDYELLFNFDSKLKMWYLYTSSSQSSKISHFDHFNSFNLTHMTHPSINNCLNSIASPLQNPNQNTIKVCISPLTLENKNQEQNEIMIANKSIISFENKRFQLDTDTIDMEIYKH